MSALTSLFFAHESRRVAHRVLRHRQQSASRHHLNSTKTNIHAVPLHMAIMLAVNSAADNYLSPGSVRSNDAGGFSGGSPRWLRPGDRTERRSQDDTPKRKMVRARLPSIAKILIQFECGAATTVQRRDCLSPFWPLRDFSPGLPQAP